MAALNPIVSSPTQNIGPHQAFDALVSDLTSRGLSVLLHALLAAEADEYVARHSHSRDPVGRALVARNGAARPRVVPLGPVTVWVSAPRVNDRRVIDGERQRFMSTLLPPNKAPCLGSGFRLASSYARALATGDFSGVLAQLTGAAARFASAEVREALEAERDALLTPELSDVRFDNIVAGAKPFDGDLRSPEAEELLALIGIRPSGGIELISIGLGLTSDPIEWSRLARVARERRLDFSDVTDGSGAPGAIEALGAAGLKVASRESVIPQSGTLQLRRSAEGDSERIQLRRSAEGDSERIQLRRSAEGDSERIQLRSVEDSNDDIEA